MPLSASHPVDRLWREPATGWLARIAAEIDARGAHAARSVVLLPYAQLMPLAQRLWAEVHPDGFAPRFETTQNWARGLGGTALGAIDLRGDAALDGLQAPALLDAAGLGAQRDALAGRLVEAAHQLAPLAAAVAPADRAAWAVSARAALATGMDSPVLAWEAAVARIALEWAAISAYTTDVLWSPGLAASLECVVVLQGFQADGLVTALAASWGDKAAVLPWQPELETADDLPPAIHAAIHAALDAEDEAQRAAACVLRHVEAGRIPVGLAAIDRLLTRRVRAMLAAHHVAIRDETGWKLSTTRAAGHLMSALRASRWDASSDAVLNWLKNAPAFAPSVVRVLEKKLRQAAATDWSGWSASAVFDREALAERVAECVNLANTLRAGLQRARPLAAWLAALRDVLQQSGQWTLLEADAAGEKLLAALRLVPGAEHELAGLPQAARRLLAFEFGAWVDTALESASFVPDYPLHEQVVITPLSQLLARPFAALVLPGCDEIRLAASPEPPGAWTAAQRAALGLPSRDAIAASQLAAWQDALRMPMVDVLWRQSDASGETLLPSPLVQAIQPGANAVAAVDPRMARTVVATPTLRPLPVGQALPVTHLSASAYEDLRRCPYRFFALRQLGLKEPEELEGEVDKRDFGNWLHAVLKTFHEGLKQAPEPEHAARLALIDAAAAATTRDMRLSEEEFLPFAAAWPRVRDGYLAWLLQHEAAGGRFEEAESQRELPLGALTLIGTIDRVDQLPAGEDGEAAVMVIDYKTENQTRTQSRIKQPLEDTQLAFYAALLPHDTLRAAYLNVGEKDGSKSFEQTAVVAARDALVHGIITDMERIAEGAVLAALGEGAACEFCAARGLCRKDFWS
ncbi:exonuclease [Rhodoferax koreense]|uniref:Exonuclease n=1 Tax=Rhodoferax koreensis TaxID=1842727 RepID=A0A1P8JXA5_9BURK|nr:PD-(D/E)XK nuclease family protein [Rhodoferax koreense]APW38392.1 exonuclease [Rhodoferax koreense]